MADMAATAQQTLTLFGVRSDRRQEPRAARARGAAVHGALQAVNTAETRRWQSYASCTHAERLSAAYNTLRRVVLTS